MIYPQPKWIATSLYLFMIAFLHTHTVVARDVTYNELVELKATCGNLDNCQRHRATDDLRVVNCQCGRVCARLGTCCVNSKYRRPGKQQVNSRFAATEVVRNSAVVFMVNDCKPGWVGDKGIKDLCEVDIGDAFFNDPFLLIPVTDQRTRITYKNLYCFACNEDKSSDKAVLWELHLFSDKDNYIPLGNISEVILDKEDAQFYPSSSNSKGFYSTVGIPEKLHRYLNWYRRDVISTCDEKWTDLEVKEKCEAYTAMVFFYDEYRYPIYRNPHCAICNFRNVSAYRCSEPPNYFPWGSPPYGFLLSGIFSLEDKVSRCPRDEVFDKFSKKCRAFRCGRNQKMVKGKCERNA